MDLNEIPDGAKDMLKQMLKTLPQRGIIQSRIISLIEELKASTSMEDLTSMPLFGILCLLADIAPTNLDYRLWYTLDDSGFIDEATQVLDRKSKGDTDNVKLVGSMEEEELRKQLDEEDDEFKGLRDLM